MTTPTPEELRDHAKRHSECVPLCATLTDNEGYWKFLERHHSLSAAALIRWADEIDREAGKHPPFCSPDYSGKCFHCGKQVFTRNEVD